MIIGTYAGMILIVILALAAIANLLGRTIFKSCFLLLLALYLPAAHYSGLDIETIGFNFLAAFIVMGLTLLISFAMANAISMNIVYFIGAVTPWIGTGQPLFEFLLTSFLLAIALSLITFAMKPVRKNLQTPPVGFAIAIAAMFYSPFAAHGMTVLGVL